ncbi:MAG: Lrp/AsnC family transcriptional regulator [Candidatus Nanoarchaeia archaeon]
MGRVDVEKKTVKLDAWDYKILNHLAMDSRASYNEIGHKALISPDTVRYRVKRMKEQGVIERFIPDVAFRLFDGFKFSLFIELEETEQEEEVIDFLQKEPHILSIIKYTDRYDLEVVIIARNVIEYDCIVNRIMSNYSHIIDDVVHFQQIESYKSAFLPGVTRPKSKKKEEIKCDKTDIYILKLLNEDARMSTYKIAEKLGVSIDTVLYRIKKMEGTVISRFTSLINFSALGHSWYTVLINLTSISSKKGKEFEEYVRNIPGVIRCVRGIGPWDMIIYIVAKNQAEYHGYINQLRKRFRGIIKDYDTLPAYKELKFEEFDAFLYDCVSK